MKTNPTKPSKPTKPIPVHFFIFPHSYIIFVFVYRFLFFSQGSLDALHR